MSFKRVCLYLFICVGIWTSSVADDVELPTHEIHFFGQKYFDEAHLQDEMGVDTASFFQFWKDSTPRLKDKLRPSLRASLKSFYESEGFYDAKFKITNTETTYTVNIIENEPIRVKNILIESDHNITHFIKFKKDDIFRTKQFISIKSKIIASLLKEGYCSYDLDTKAYVDLEKHSVDLEYRLKEGGLCTFGHLTTSGLETIDESVVKSRVIALEGEVYSTELIQDTSNNLYALHAFDSVVIDVNRKFYNVVPVDIQFSELKNPYHTEIGVGYDTYVGPKVHAQITKYNFLGQAQQIGLKTLWSSREQLLIANFFKPDLFTLFDRSIDFGGSTGYSNLEFDGFKEEKYFLNAYLEHKNKRLKLRLGVTSESLRIAALDNLGSRQLQQAVNEGNFVLFYPYIDVVYDGRDSKLNSKYGYYLAGYTEFGLSKNENSSVYYKTQLEARVIHTFSDLTLAAVGKVGVIDDESGKGLPESKYFFGGGSYSNRAYGYRELGVILSPTQDTINGASSMANFSLEADYPILGNLYGAVFTDNTMLTDKAYDFKGEIISTAGAGVRYMTPIGPFKLDIGFNVADPAQYGISFQIGQSF